MGRQPANTFDERLSRMTAALRGEAMPSPPAGTMMTGKVRRRSRLVAALLATGSVAALAAVLAIISIPRRSAASEVQRIASAGVGLIRHELQYHLEPDGTSKIIGEIYTDGNRVHMVPHGRIAEQWEGDRIANYFHNEFDPSRNYATIENRPRVPSFLFDNSLKRLLRVNHPIWVKDEGDVQWRGMNLRRYDMYCEGRDALNQILKFSISVYADPKTDLPYYERSAVSGDEKGQFQGGDVSVFEWDYPATADLDVSLPPGTPVYDLDRMREAVKDQVTGSLGTDTVDGVKVTLRAVYANENGGLDVFTTGGTGRAEQTRAGLRVDGKETDGAFSAGQNHGHWAGKVVVYEPLNYRGLKLIYQAGGWMKLKIPDVIDLEVPVWKPDNSALGRHLAGYAKFNNVVPIRYAGQILADRHNRSVLWTSRDSEIERKFWEDTRKGAPTPTLKDFDRPNITMGAGAFETYKRLKKEELAKERKARR